MLTGYHFSRNQRRPEAPGAALGADPGALGAECAWHRVAVLAS